MQLPEVHPRRKVVPLLLFSLKNECKCFSRNSCFAFILLNMSLLPCKRMTVGYLTALYSYKIKSVKMKRHYISHHPFSYATRFLRAFHTNLPVPEARGRLLVWTKKILHGEVSIKDPRESFHPLSVHSCISTACHYHLLLLFLHAEESGTSLRGTSG